MLLLYCVFVCAAKVRYLNWVSQNGDHLGDLLINAASSDSPCTTNNILEAGDCTKNHNNIISKHSSGQRATFPKCTDSDGTSKIGLSSPVVKPPSPSGEFQEDEAGDGRGLVIQLLRKRDDELSLDEMSW